MIAIVNKERLILPDKAKQAANDQRAYDKTMEKYRRVKQNVETALRNTKNDVAGRLLAKKMKTVLSQEKRFEKGSSVHDPKATWRGTNQLFFQTSNH